MVLETQATSGAFLFLSMASDDLGTSVACGLGGCAASVDGGASYEKLSLPKHLVRERNRIF